MDLKRESSRLEQRTLVLSLLCVVVIALGSLAWGLAIESGVVILNGVFSLVSLIGSVLYVTAARLVARPADRRFPDHRNLPRLRRLVPPAPERRHPGVQLAVPRRHPQ